MFHCVFYTLDIPLYFDIIFNREYNGGTLLIKSKKNILVKYLFKELWIYFLIAFSFFFLIFFVNHLLLTAEDILEKRVPVDQVLLFIWYSLPFIIAQSAPFATLVGFLMCLGRMVSDNEILILRSTGHSFVFLITPAILLGLIISLGSFFVNDYLLPMGTIAYNKLYISILVSNPSVELEPHSIKRFEDSTLIIGDVNDKTISDLMLFDTDSSGIFRVIAASDVDVVSPKDTSVAMQLNMGNATAVFLDEYNEDTYDYLESKNASMNLFSSSFFPSYSTTNPREMTFYDLDKEINSLRADQNTNPQLLNTYELEFHKKFSLPFGSIFFAFLAFPIAILFGKNNGQTIGLIVGICIAVLYWAFLILGQQFGLQNGWDGFLTMWVPNFLVGLFGLIFYIRLLKK